VHNVPQVIYVTRLVQKSIPQRHRSTLNATVSLEPYMNVQGDNRQGNNRRQPACWAEPISHRRNGVVGI
jgi:hypothetical protein